MEKEKSKDVDTEGRSSQRGSGLRMVERADEGGPEGDGNEMDESCWGLKGASERVNLK